MHVTWLLKPAPQIVQLLLVYGVIHFSYFGEVAYRSIFNIKKSLKTCFFNFSYFGPALVTVTTIGTGVGKRLGTSAVNCIISIESACVAAGWAANLHHEYITYGNSFICQQDCSTPNYLHFSEFPVWWGIPAKLPPCQWRERKERWSWNACVVCSDSPIHSSRIVH